MTDHDVQHRTHYQPDPDRVEVRDSDDEAGVFSVRMPIATTGEVRNEGDDPLTREEIDGMATQVDAGGLGVFIDHGSNYGLAESRYSATEKVGEWETPDTQQRDGGGITELVATARMMDPESLPESAGAVREALTILKEQAQRDMSLSASIGWGDDRSAPGGVDLMEASLVGIPADPRTTSQDTPTAIAARALAAEDDDEFERRLTELRAVVMGPADDEGGDARDSVTDDTDQSGDDPDETTDEQAERQEAPDWAERLLEMQEQQTDSVQDLADALREEDDDDEDDDEDEEDDETNEGDDEDEDDDEDETEQDADTEGAAERTVEIDGEELDVQEVVDEHRETLAAIRRGGVDLDDLDVQAPGGDDDESSESTRETTDDETDPNDPVGWLS